MIVQKIQLINFKNISEFQAEFTKGVYLVTGENDKGKSNLISAIVTCLTGTRSANLLKQGEEKGSVSVEVGDDIHKFTLELRFSDKNPRGTLYVKDQNTGMETSNLSALQKMFQYTDFDAHEFVAMSKTAEGRKRQVEIVKNLLPEDIRTTIQKIEEELPVLETNRREWGRKVKDLQGSIKEMGIDTEQAEFYSKEIDVDDLSKRITEGSERNNKIRNAKEELSEMENQLGNFDEETENQESKITDQMMDIESEILRLQEKQKNLAKEKQEYIKAREESKSNLQNSIKGLKTEANRSMTSIDSLREQMSQASDHNKMVMKVEEYKNKNKLLQATIKEHSKLDDKIKELRDTKKDLIQSAKLPIEGLSFEDDQLTINGIPLAPGEVSTSQEIEIAAKLIIAMNPKMKVFKMMNGESLGSEKFKAIVEFAKKEGYQGFVEEMHRGQDDLKIEEYTEA